MGLEGSRGRHDERRKEWIADGRGTQGVRLRLSQEASDPVVKGGRKRKERDEDGGD